MQREILPPESGVIPDTPVTLETEAGKDSLAIKPFLVSNLANIE